MPEKRSCHDFITTRQATAQRISFLHAMDAGDVSYLIHHRETEAVGEEGFQGEGIGRCNF